MKKEFGKKNKYMTYITESLCCTPEINTTLLINFASIKNIFNLGFFPNQGLRDLSHGARSSPLPHCSENLGERGIALREGNLGAEAS